MNAVTSVFAGTVMPASAARSMGDDRTYAITLDHQGNIVDRLNETAGEILGLDTTELRQDELTDATDDFDFVRADDRSLRFTALDGTLRTDTWLSNEAELARGTAPWDPNTDDGLTDGQAFKRVTTVIQTDRCGPGPESRGIPITRDRTIAGHGDGGVGGRPWNA